MDKLKRLLKKTPPVPLGIAGALLFLLLFYTDYMGISPVWAGAVMLVSRLWDGIRPISITTK